MHKDMEHRGAATQCALISGDRFYTYGGLNAMVNHCAHRLHRAGVKPNTRVALTGQNSPEFIIHLLALWHLRAVAVPLSFRLPPDTRETIRQNLGISHPIIDCDLDLLMPPDPAKPFIRDPRDADDGGVIIMTSGSTATGKAVLHRLGAFYENARGSNENIPLTPGDRWLLSLPLFHVGGLGIVFRCLTAGATVVIPRPGPSPITRMAKYIQTLGITHLSLVPTQLKQLLDGGFSPGPGLKALLLGGGQSSPQLIRAALDAGYPVHTTYGLSEMASQVTTTPGGKIGGVGGAGQVTSGKMLSHAHLRIDEKTNEILVGGPSLFKGYIERKWERKGGKEILVKPFTPDGLFPTGDLGYLDRDGYLTVTGRRDNMFISGGENIMPEEIEEQINRLPGVETSVVVPVPDDTYGARPVAFIKFSKGKEGQEGKAIDATQLTGQLEKVLPRFKVPKILYQWPATGAEGDLKIRRGHFRELVHSPHPPEAL